MTSTKKITREDNALVTVDGTTAFPAFVDFTDRWNGWLCPRFTRETAERVVEWLNRTFEEAPEASDRAEWQEDVILHFAAPALYGDEPDYAPERVGPGEQDGRYGIGGYYWTWSLAEGETSA